MPPSPESVLEGAGVHTGVPCRLRLVRRSPDDGRGVRFSIPGHAGSLVPGDLARLPRQARRATVIGSGGGSVHTPEHFLAALLFFAGCPLDAVLEGPELPNLDGSALAFREALADLFPEAAAAPAWREHACGLEWEHAWPEGYVRAAPAARFSVAWTLDRGPLSETCRLESAALAWSGILPARTWIFERERRRGLELGLLRGAGPDSGLLLAESPGEHAAFQEAGSPGPGGPFPLLNQAAWRMEGEPVRHKVLDLLGDLALRNLTLPSLRIEIRNGGHAANHALLEKLDGIRS